MSGKNPVILVTFKTGLNGLWISSPHSITVTQQFFIAWLLSIFYLSYSLADPGSPSPKVWSWYPNNCWICYIFIHNGCGGTFCSFSGLFLTNSLVVLIVLLVLLTPLKLMASMQQGKQCSELCAVSCAAQFPI